MRDLGYLRAAYDTAVVAESQEGEFIALLEYYALKRFAKLLAQNINISKTGISISAQQAFANVQKLLEMALAEIKRYGYGGSGGFGLARIGLDFLEPDLQFA